MTADSQPKNPVGFLALLLLLLLAGLPVAVWLDLRSLTDEALLTESASVSGIIDDVRSFYTDEIIGRIEPGGGEVRLSHEFRDQHQTLPIPATFSKELARLIGGTEKNISYRFVSDFPFIGRGDGDLDAFEQAALTAFRDGRTADFVQTNGGWFNRQVRIATPVIMGAACVACHDSHPLSTKTDWKVGDVRGIQAVTAGRDITSNIFNFKYLIAYFLFAGTTSILVLSTQQRQSQRIAQFNTTLTQTNTALETTQTELQTTLGRLEDDLEEARRFQELALPQDFPRPDSLDFASYFLPARHVGGDFFDVFTLPSGKIGFVMADVSDKGVKAAFFAAVARSVLVEIANEEAEPAVTLVRVNERLCKQNPAELFVTMLYGVIDLEQQCLDFSNCAHLQPVLRSTDGAAFVLDVEPCIPIGIFPQVVPDQMCIPFKPGDTLCVFTDGVTDAGTNTGDPFGEDRVIELLSDSGLHNAKQMCDLIQAKQLDHAPGDQFDDAAFLAIRRI